MLLRGVPPRGTHSRPGQPPEVVHAVIHEALADAQRKGSVIRSVAGLADPPKLSTRARPEMTVWAAGELQRFLKLAEDHPLYSAFYVKANTGMPRGEFLGLAWRDTDFDHTPLLGP